MTHDASSDAIAWILSRFSNPMQKWTLTPYVSEIGGYLAVLLDIPQ